MGRLILADLYLCPRDILEEKHRLRIIIEEMFRNFGEPNQELLILSGDGEGFIGLFRIGGARISFQTFPSYNYLALELFVVGVIDLSLYSEYLVEKVKPQVVTVREFARGEHLEANV